MGRYITGLDLGCWRTKRFTYAGTE